MRRRHRRRRGGGSAPGSSACKRALLRTSGVEAELPGAARHGRSVASLRTALRRIAHVHAPNRGCGTVVGTRRQLRNRVARIRRRGIAWAAVSNTTGNAVAGHRRVGRSDDVHSLRIAKVLETEIATFAVCENLSTRVRMRKRGLTNVCKRDVGTRRCSTHMDSGTERHVLLHELFGGGRDRPRQLVHSTVGESITGGSEKVLEFYQRCGQGRRSRARRLVFRTVALNGPGVAVAALGTVVQSLAHVRVNGRTGSRYRTVNAPAPPGRRRTA